MRQLGLPHFLGFIRQLLLRDKLKSKNLDKEMMLYLTVNIWVLKNLETVCWV